MARSDTLSTWSEGEFHGTTQRGASLVLARVLTTAPLASTLQTDCVATLGTYEVALKLAHPASVDVVPAVTQTIPASEGQTVTETRTTPAFPGWSYHHDGNVMGIVHYSVDLSLPATEAKTEEVTYTVGAHDEYTIEVSPESSTYKTRGYLKVAGEYVAADPSIEVRVMLGDKELARGFGRIPFNYSGDAASCKNAVQNIETLNLIARSDRGALSAAGFATTVSGPQSGYWLSPWLRVGAFDIERTFRAFMQAQGRPGTRPTLMVRSKDAAGTTGWTNLGLRATDTEFQFMVMLEEGQSVHALSWTFETEYIEPQYDFSTQATAAAGGGLAYQPKLSATVDGLDVSALLSEVGSGSLTLAVPVEQAVVPRIGAKVQIMLDDHVVDTGLVAGVTRPGGPSGSRMELNFLRSGQLLGAKTVYTPSSGKVEPSVSGKSLTVIGRTGAENPTPVLPFSDEGGFVTHILANSPGNTRLLLDTNRGFRSLQFWSDPHDKITGEGGLGFEELTDWQVHYGDQNKVGLDVIEQVCAANLLGVYPLETGDLMLSDLIPAPDKTLGQLLEETTLPTGETVSSAYLRFHDQGGRFFPDHRLSIPERAHDVSDMASFVEVVGTSGPSQVNQENRELPVYVMFEQGMTPTKEGKCNLSTASFLNLGGGSHTNSFTLVDKNGKPIAIRIGSERTDHVVTSQRGNWHVEISFEQGTLPYEDVDGDGQELGDNDDVTGYTTVHVKTTLTDMTTFGHIDLVFHVYGEYLVHGEWETLELRGKPNQQFVPRWLPDLLTDAGHVRRTFGFETRTEQNPFVTSLKGYPLGASAEVQRQWETLPDHVATALTLKETLQSRATELRYCGYAGWVPNQFVAVAKPPLGGIGAEITHWEVYLTLNAGTLDAAVGGEINHVVEAAYLGTVMKNAAGQLVTASHDVTSSDWFSTTV